MPARSTPESELEELAAEAISTFESSGSAPGDLISRLVERTLEYPGASFFTHFVEPIADSFRPSGVALYNHVMSRLIHRWRSLNAGGEFDRELTALGLRSEHDLIARAERLRQSGSGLRAGCSPVRALVLSRVTVGADVAISSVIIQRLKLLESRPEIVLIGDPRLEEILCGDGAVKLAPLRYRRTGSVSDRLECWIELRRVVETQVNGLSHEEYLIVDPDTRLTQLGLLPPGDDRACMFFPSREYRSEGADSLGRLAGEWLDEELGGDLELTPALNLGKRDIELARPLIESVGRAGTRPVASINLGVGGNLSKRVGPEFERLLVTGFLDRGLGVVLDRGAGDQELEAVDLLMESCEAAGHRVAEVSSESLDLRDADVVAVRGGLGLLAALVSLSDIYTGYDSAGQHIAAAAGVPCVDVFAGFGSSRMVDRWQPHGRGEIRVVRVEKRAPARETAGRVLKQVDSLLNIRRSPTIETIQ